MERSSSAQLPPIGPSAHRLSATGHRLSALSDAPHTQAKTCPLVDTTRLCMPPADTSRIGYRLSAIGY
jgi:hypothetical protein